MVPLLAVLARAAGTVLRSGGIEVDVASTGGYTLKVDGATWLISAPPTFLGQVVQVTGIVPSTGTDKHGAFDAVAVHWGVKPPVTVLTTIFAAYASTEMLSFKQQWPTGVPNTTAFYNSSTSEGVALGQFPSFIVGNATEKPMPELNWFAFNGCQIQVLGNR